jgi:hypothetical protein
MVAYQAIMRLQLGLNKDSPWIDPEEPEFDADRVIKDFQRWQYQPFVKLILDVKRQTLVHPFVPERLAALQGVGRHWRIPRDSWTTGRVTGRPAHRGHQDSSLRTGA